MNRMYSLLIGLFLLLAPVSVADCPKALADSHYVSRCTGKRVQYKSITYEDCGSGEIAAKDMDRRIVELIEKLRCEVGDRMRITSAFRSEKHNLYSWAYISARSGDETIVAKKSKHVFGKAIDFYIEGSTFEEHRKYEKKLHMWAGKFDEPLRRSRDKIWTKTYQETEGRDPDNQHTYPYIHIEMRE